MAATSHGSHLDAYIMMPVHSYRRIHWSPLPDHADLGRVVLLHAVLIPELVVHLVSDAGSKDKDPDTVGIIHI